MNMYLLQFACKWLSLIVVSISSLFMSVGINSKTIDNENQKKNLNVINEIIEYDTEYTYNSKLPSNVRNTLIEGVDGILYIDNETKEEKVIAEPVTEVIEVGTGDYGEYTGRMTGYGPDCVGCSKVGNVACFTKDRKNHSLINDGIYYEDDEYGKVRILAASHKKFPCGTIVYVNNGILEPFYGIVLDTGIDMRKAWDNDGVVWMDLAFNSEAESNTGGATSRNTSYSVKRWGF